MPADEYKMDPPPDYMPRHPSVGKLKDKVAFITGGDSGIGRAVSVLFAREGAKVAIAYLRESRDAEETKRLVEAEGSEALLIEGDLGDKAHAKQAVTQAAEHFGRLDILVNNAAQQWIDEDLPDLSEERLRRVMDSNVMSYFFCSQAALPHLKEGAAIINTTSVNAFKGNPMLIAYSTSRGASLAFTRSMSANLDDKGIRVNAVAPGPVWTPFIPGSMPEDMVADFGSGSPMGRAAQPWEVATCYLFLASSDGNVFTGPTLHPYAGMIVGASAPAHQLESNRAQSRRRRQRHGRRRKARPCRSSLWLSRSHHRDPDHRALHQRHLWHAGARA